MIKKILVGNGYPLELIKRDIKSYNDNCKKPKLLEPEKFPAVLKLQYLGNVSLYFKRKCKN